MCYASSKLLNKKGEQKFTRIQNIPLLGVQEGEFIDFVFLFIHQTKLRRDTEYPTGKQSIRRNQSYGHRLLLRKLYRF